MVGFEKFGRQAKSAVIPHYEKLFYFKIDWQSFQGRKKNYLCLISSQQ